MTANLDNLIAVNNPLVFKKTIVGDVTTPVALMAKIRGKYDGLKKYHFLFESVEKASNKGRYSIVGFDPDIVFKCKNKKVGVVNFLQSEKFVDVNGDGLEILRDVIKKSQIVSDTKSDLDSMSSGVFGYLGYDMVKLMEDLPDYDLKDDINIADSIFIRPQVIVIFDSIFDKITICMPFYDSGLFDENKAKKRMDEIIELINAPLVEQKKDRNLAKGQFSSNFEKNEYCKVVEKCKDHIFKGDIFQVVASQRFSADFDLQYSFDFYRTLRSLNPSPFMFFIEMEDFCFCGSSPEILVGLKDNIVTIRPLAGTRKRGVDAKEDAKNAADLLNDEKELAEHLMLIDLGRHDVGRVCKNGSVKLTEKMIIEYYSHVMHISSNIQGILKDDKVALDALISGFPAGTVSGAPKIRAMEIIEDVEKDKRSFYAGCVGYFAGNGDMQNCISLRSALIKGGKIYFQTGAGIVADSDLELEYQECFNKARALMVAYDEV